MKYAVQGYPQDRSFEIIERKRNRVRVSDGITNARWMNKNDVAPIGRASLEQLQRRRFIDNNALFTLRRRYFRNEFSNFDADLINAYVIRGMPRWLAEQAISYETSDFSYLYAERAPRQVRNGGLQPVTKFVNVQYQVATSKPFDEVNKEPQTGYGSPSVLAQWIYYNFSPEVDVQRIIREESEKIDDTTYVIRCYTNVSELGAVDGELTRISLYRLVDDGDYTHAQGWRGYEYTRKALPNGDYLWKAPRDSYGGEPYLNGAQQMDRFNDGIDCLKVEEFNQTVEE